MKILKRTNTDILNFGYNVNTICFSLNNHHIDTEIIENTFLPRYKGCYPTIMTNKESSYDRKESLCLLSFKQYFHIQDYLKKDKYEEI